MNAQEKVNILLVDDQPDKLLSYEVILGELGETLVKAGSASEALEHLLKIDVAVILVDVCMPDLDGFELASMIRQHPRFEKTAIIFVSAIQVNDLDLLRGYAVGAVDYVPVPVVPDLLRAKVRVFAELYRKTKQLEALNTELERRVAERTIELALANAELERRVEERTREREAALAQVHEMQKLESLGQLTGGIAHDFNNLLTAVLGNLDILRHHLAEQPKFMRLVEGAIQAAERGATLTERMLAFARRQELRPTLVDVSSLVDGMKELLERSIGPTIRIIASIPDDLPRIRIDPNQLELAVLNLALNARDAMPEGGELTITATPRRIDADQGAAKAGQYLCLAVRDSGAGMDEATLKRATEPFFTTKGIGKGTGLGLSMVDGLMAQSGGSMRIDSALGRGTAVELCLPVATDVQAPPEPEPLAFESAGFSCKVLVVDDDAIVASGLVALLEDLGHTVVESRSGRAALDLLRADADLDLVITDQVMPDMTGLELIERIREGWPRLPSMLASGYGELPTGASSDQMRLSKPYRRHELVAAIGTIVGRRQTQAPRFEDRRRASG